MRLRLRIERNGLPSTQALWPIKDIKSTIAQLLQHVNDVFPLEADTWGLEDYSVSVGGFECLHYHELAAICRDEDEVLIKPLQYFDVRARTLTGRDQIAPDGRHLVDGVPFGRPALKAPIRPDIRIPPRKKRRLLEDTGGGDREEDNEQLLLKEHEDQLSDSDEEEEEEDFEANGSDDETSDDSSENDDGSSEESDTSSDDHASDGGSDDTPHSEAEDGDSWNGFSSSTQTTPRHNIVSKRANNVIANHRSSRDDSHAAEVDSEDEADGQNHDRKRASLVVSLPYQGASDTRARNARRRDAKKLKHLKAIKILPSDATLDTLRLWQEQRNDVPRRTVVDTNMDTTTADQQPALEESEREERPELAQKPDTTIPGALASALNMTDVDSVADKKVQQAATLEEQRRRLVASIDSGGIDVTDKAQRKKNKRKQQPTIDLAGGSDTEEPPEELSTKEPLIESIVQPLEQTADSPLNDNIARRSKLDLEGSQRLLFGSLGVRVPKTQEDRDRLQKKLADRPKRNAVTDVAGISVANGVGTTAPAEPAQQQPEVDDDPDAWRNKINLTAVECCDEGMTLSTPPFPFYQRWDPQQRKGKLGKRKSETYMDNSGNKRKRGKREPEYIESYDKYNTDGNGDALEYDDVEDEDEEYWEDGALLDGERGEDEAEDDGFPDLPKETNDLPTLTQDEAREGDYITFTELAVDESTGWQPKTVERTAKILQNQSNRAGAWLLQLSKRDTRTKVFDDEGNRVYSKFEMPDEDEDEDSGQREVEWAALGPVKLVMREQSANDV